MKRYIYGGQTLGLTKFERSELIIKEELPNINITKESNEPIFQSEAKSIHQFLLNNLPGGTYDRVFAEMVKHKASKLVVSHKDRVGKK